MPSRYLAYSVHPDIAADLEDLDVFDGEQREPHEVAFCANIKNPSQPLGITVSLFSWCAISDSLQSEISPFSHSSPIKAESPIDLLV